jgi:hypothetical protein
MMMMVNAHVIVLKIIQKFLLNIAPTCFSAVTPPSGSALFVLAEVTLPNSATYTHQQGHYQYMQPHHHRINHTPMYRNWLFYQSVTLASTNNALPEDGVTGPKHVGAILM